MPKKRKENPFAWINEDRMPPRDAASERDAHCAKTKPFVPDLMQEATLCLFAWVNCWNKSGDKNKPTYAVAPHEDETEKGVVVLRLGTGNPPHVFSVSKYVNGRWRVQWYKKNFASANRFCEDAELIATIEEMLSDREVSLASSR